MAIDLGTVTRSIFKGGVLKSSQYYKTSTAIVINEFIRPDLSGCIKNGATISALAHGPYITISIENWNPIATVPPTSGHIRLAVPFSFAIVDATVHTIDPFTLAIGTPYMDIYNGTLSTGLRYLDASTANAISRNSFAGWWRLLEKLPKVNDEGALILQGSTYGRSTPIASVTKANTILTLSVSGEVSGTYKGTINLKVVPMSEGFVNSTPFMGNFA